MFDLWLARTTGVQQVRRWIELKQWRQIAIAAAIAVILAVVLPVFIRYNAGVKMRVQGFPVPLLFAHLEDNKTWTRTTLPGVLPYFGVVTDILTGLAAPFIPYKIADFLKKVKAELK